MTPDPVLIPRITITPEPTADERDAIVAALMVAAAQTAMQAAPAAASQLTPWARAARLGTLRSDPAPLWGTPFGASRWSRR